MTPKRSLKKIAQLLSKTTMLAMIAMFISSAVNAQIKTAVLDFKAGVGVGQDDVDGISAIFGTYFINPQKFTLVERMQIDRVITEQGFQYSSLTNKQMVRVGEILNISKIVVGDVNIVSGQYNVDVRVVNVETGTVEATDGETWARGTSYRELMKNLATRLMAKINFPSTDAVSDRVIVLFGYLYVFPEDLGSFDEYPAEMIDGMNKAKAYGIGNWRLPTEAEVKMLKQNAEKLNLKMVSLGNSGGPNMYDYCYWYTDGDKMVGTYTWFAPYRSGSAARYIRLVSTRN